MEETFKGNSAIEDFNQRCDYLSESDIFQLNAYLTQGPLNNLVIGINDEVYGYWLDNNSKEEYYLFYACCKKNLEGYLLRLNISCSSMEELTFIFATFLSGKYDLDLLDTFNHFQKYTRELLECLGYCTISTTEFKRTQQGDLYVKHDKFLKINFIEKEDFYHFFFNFSAKTLSSIVASNISFIYLMLNKRNNFVKIGRSKNPVYREKTLQADEPEIILIACWPAPAQVETQLHREFSHKKQRGEWFDLNFNDYKKIKDIMFQYNL